MHKALSNFDPPSLSLHPPLYKPSLTLSSLTFLPSSLFLLYIEEKGEKDKDKRGKGEEGKSERVYIGERGEREKIESEGGSKLNKGPRVQTLNGQKN